MKRDYTYPGNAFVVLKSRLHSVAVILSHRYQTGLQVWWLLGALDVYRDRIRSNDGLCEVIGESVDRYPEVAT